MKGRFSVELWLSVLAQIGMSASQVSDDAAGINLCLPHETRGRARHDSFPSRIATTSSRLH